VGRIKTVGMVLVDQQEARELLECSRATFWRKLKAGELHRIELAGGGRTVYVTLDSVDRCINSGPQFALKDLESEVALQRRAQELVRRFPSIVKPHRDLPGRMSAAPDPLPSPEE
jgi:hypothetical protein